MYGYVWMISGWDEFSKMGIDGRLGINQTQDDFGVMPHQLVCQVNPGFFSSSQESIAPLQSKPWRITINQLLITQPQANLSTISLPIFFHNIEDFASPEIPPFTQQTRWPTSTSSSRPSPGHPVRPSYAQGAIGHSSGSLPHSPGHSTASRAQTAPGRPAAPQRPHPSSAAKTRATSAETCRKWW